ncbi:MAG: zinc-binding dehydrogenase [Opitutaceae bacterium]|nr:zinc-binding dehydrogenase [Opitutaceae bacterium]
MRAIQFTAVNQIEVREVPEPVPASGEVLVRIRAAALNHRDLWIKLGQYAGLQFPCTPGSDGVGEVCAVGPGVDAETAARWMGRRVVINPAFDWGSDPVAVPVDQLAEAPAHLSDDEAAALPLAGLTAWRAVMTRGAVRRGDKVLISGVGGGAAVAALQFAVAAGAKTWVTSSSAEKIDRARALGAEAGFDYTRSDWVEAARAAVPGGFDVIIDSAGGEGFEKLIDLAAAGGRLVFFGATRGNPPVLPMRKVFWRQLSLLGTTMGSPDDWRAMLETVSRHRIRPVVGHGFAFAQAASAFDLMEQGSQFGKIVVRP